jgi:hypothetical protein
MSHLTVESTVQCGFFIINVYQFIDQGVFCLLSLFYIFIITSNISWVSWQFVINVAIFVPDWEATF